MKTKTEPKVLKRAGTLLLSLSSMVSIGCGSDTSTFSIPPDADTFFQNANSAQANSKIDMVWVIDNSGSMQTSQNNLRANFPAFISQFNSLGLDYKIVVTTSDAYLALPEMIDIYNYYRRTSLYGSMFESKHATEKARFKDGYGSNHSGVFELLPTTPDLINVFSINATQGIYGYGDERPLQSMKTALESSLNTGFLRDGSHLAVMLLTDEDDFSHNTTDFLDGQYTNSRLHTVSSYYDFLSAYTGSTEAKQNFSVHSISINTQDCLTSLNNSFTERKIARRVQELVDLAGGIKADLCGNFADELQTISNKIIQLSTQFYLSRVPIVETLKVFVSGTELPTPQGWIYDADSNSIVFKAGYTPPQGAAINVTFDPKYLDK